MLIDVAEIKIKAGNGGDGHVSFRKEKFIPRGGPSGGDGGNGGDVYFVAAKNLATLMDFRSRPNYLAKNGEPGGKKKMYGPSGEDLIVKVPLGTLVYENVNLPANLPAQAGAGNKEVLVADLVEHDQKFLIAKGGIGGKGNFRFRSSTNRAPVQYTPGTEGEQKEVKLEVKLVADVGLIGFPNAGKSTLINKVTNSNAKVANYPFTTLSPNLGVCRLKSGEEIILSDIPGLIEGASKGKGLGGEFLRHVERTRILVHLVDPMDGIDQDIEQKDYPKALSTNSVDKYLAIRGELKDYGKGLESKEEIVVINKIDLTEISDNFDTIVSAFKDKNINVLGISAVSGEGVSFLLDGITQILQKIPKKPIFEPQTPIKLYNISNLPNKRMVFGESRVLTMEERKR